MSEPRPGPRTTRPPPGRPTTLGLAELAWRVSGALPKAERRALVLRLLEAEAEEVTFRRDGTRWTAFPWDHMVSGPLFVSGSFQEHEVRAVLAWMARHGRLGGPRDVIVDVGANIGTSTIPFAQARPDCRVVAIEPVPDIVALLRRNVADNGLTDRITCVQAAISASGRDRVQMVLPDGNGGGGEIRRPHRPPSFTGRHAVRGVVDVPALGLAELLRARGVAPERVAFVWSDSQGSETDVIASGRPLWAAGVPLFAELDPATWDGAGGADAILAAAAPHFAAFIGAEALIADVAAPPRPLAELAAFCRTIGPDASDALLLPDGLLPSPGRRLAART